MTKAQIIIREYAGIIGWLLPYAIVISILFLMMALYAMNLSNTRRLIINCDSFSSYKGAQDALVLHLGLDRNKDGRPCNEKFKK